jgi:hypothetical protein
MSSITKDQLIFDTTNVGDSDSVGAYVRSSDGTLIDHVTIAAVDRLAVDTTLNDGAGNDITSTGGALDVNVAAATGLAIYAEDSVHTSGDDGQFVLGVRQDADTSPVSADGDYHGFIFDDVGQLKVRASVVATVDPSNAEYAEDSPHTSGDVGLHMLSVRQDTLASSTSADGDYASLKVDSLGRLYVAAAISGDVADDDPDSGNPLKVGSRAVDGALTAISASNDRADLLSDMYRRIWVNPSANISLQSSAVAIDDTAGGTELAATPLAGRRKLLIQNQGNGEVYIGQTGVTTATGVELRRRTSLELEIGEDVNIFAICDTGETADLRVLEIA